MSPETRAARSRSGVRKRGYTTCTVAGVANAVGVAHEEILAAALGLGLGTFRLAGSTWIRIQCGKRVAA